MIVTIQVDHTYNNIIYIGIQRYIAVTYQTEQPVARICLHLNQTHVPVKDL